MFTDNPSISIAANSCNNAIIQQFLPLKCERLGFLFDIKLVFLRQKKTFWEFLANSGVMLQVSWLWLFQVCVFSVLMKLSVRENWWLIKVL